MGALFRLLASAVLGMGLLYVLFVVDLQGKNVASHLLEVWRSEVVQQKFDLVKSQVTEEIEARLARVQRPPEGAGRRDLDLDPVDREALKRIIAESNDVSDNPSPSEMR